jgi:hypothetical protein
MVGRDDLETVVVGTCPEGRHANEKYQNGAANAAEHVCHEEDPLIAAIAHPQSQLAQVQTASSAR